jgi:NhaP-type Na+/H+ or K+/H+ antiporter
MVGNSLLAPLARTPGFPLEPGAYELLLAVSGAALLVGTVVLSVQRGRPFSAAIIYLAIGVAIGLGVAWLDADWFDPITQPELLTRMAEFAVIVSLFGAGVKLDTPFSWRAWRATAMLLALAMPLTIAGVALAGSWLLSLSLPAAILLGAALAPTDPVLADDVQVRGPGDEEPEDEARFAITSEAGLNDGLAFPFVMLALFAMQQAPGAGATWLVEWALADALIPVGIGLVGGVIGGRFIARLTYGVAGRGWLAAPFDGYIALASTFVVYGTVELIEGYGFVAVFAAGIAFRRFEHEHEYNRRLHEFTLVIEKLSELAVMLVLGSVLPLAVGYALRSGLLLPMLGVAAALLIAVRPLAVGISLLGSATGRRERLFIGWFGIRGIGSVYYLSFALASFTTAEAPILFATACVTVVASVVLHGLTSSWLTRRLLGQRGE